MLIYDWNGIKISIKDSRFVFTPKTLKDQKVTLIKPDIEINLDYFNLINDFTGTAFIKGACQAFMRNKLLENSYENSNSGVLSVKKASKNKISYLRLEVIKEEEVVYQKFCDFQEVCMLDLALSKAVNAFSIVTIPTEEMCRFKNEPKLVM